ncbi:GmrSD restriction endonuclease domain-containing protein [Glutamicibacter arilaitensis]|uniref:GmrSD restriction endonuclease domain-containing protein n=1 Tax=Glutamicibacter arilaitensis TaxID=256701 RepID=UPI003FD14D46
MEALNRDLKNWFQAIEGGRLRLPRFQRFEAWSHNEVSSLVETVLRKLPAGALLTLSVDNDEPFLSRELTTAPKSSPGTRVTEHLLDGQQRLTALWRALHDNYESRTYFIKLEEDADEDGVLDGPRVLSQYRWNRNGSRYPLWCNNPTDVLDRGYVPLRLLNPMTTSGRDEWVLAAMNDDHARAWKLNSQINELAHEVAIYNIPYLSLPVTTPKDVALDVFIKMNTSSVRLSAYDIVVAQLEEATGQSLHDLVQDLETAVPAVTRYFETGSLVLDVAALRSDRPATQRSYSLLNYETLAAEWPQVVNGIKWVVEFLEAERVYDKQRLPSVTPIPVVAALAEYIPVSLDEAGNARRLLRAYLWRSFITRRYDQSASSRALQDFRGLRKLLLGEETDWASVPIFDEDMNPLPTFMDLESASWPRNRDVIARGILAATLREGARDIADDQTVNSDNLVHREYHHLFPDSLLNQIGAVGQQSSYRALNCALITWSTNRNISNKAPLQYLSDRVDRSDVGESAIRDRLASHLIPYDELASAGPYTDDDKVRLTDDYQRFIRARAKLVLTRVLSLCNGQ